MGDLVALAQPEFHMGDIADAYPFSCNGYKGGLQCFGRFLAIDGRKIEMAALLFNSSDGKNGTERTDGFIDTLFGQAVGSQFLVVYLDEHLIVRISTYGDPAEILVDTQFALEVLCDIEQPSFGDISGDRHKQQRKIMHRDLCDGFIHICRQIPPDIGDNIFDIPQDQLVVAAGLDVCPEGEKSVLYHRVYIVYLADTLHLIFDILDRHLVKYISRSTRIASCNGYLVKFRRREYLFGDLLICKDGEQQHEHHQDMVDYRFVNSERDKSPYHLTVRVVYDKDRIGYPVLELQCFDILLKQYLFRFQGRDLSFYFVDLLALIIYLIAQPYFYCCQDQHDRYGDKDDHHHLEGDAVWPFFLYTFSHLNCHS